MAKKFNVREIERRIIVSSRFFTVLAVFGSLAASILMFFLGLYNIYEAFWEGLSEGPDDKTPFGTAAVISVIEALDRFLIGIVLLYFAYGVYSLFVHPEDAEEELALPAWLRIHQIGQLKQVVAEVIVVVLFVLFLRIVLQSFQQPNVTMTWLQIATLALLPVSTALLGLALRLVELHPKPAKPQVLHHSELPPESDRKPTGKKVPDKEKGSRSA
jgi:uncharacterized membrane protein YqhA